MAEFKVTSGTLRNKATELRRLKSQFTNQVQNLVSQEGTLNGQWEGEAHDFFHREFMKDKGQWDTFARVVEEYARVLDQNASTYERAENENRQIANERTYH